MSVEDSGDGPHETAAEQTLGVIRDETWWNTVSVLQHCPAHLSSIFTRSLSRAALSCLRFSAAAWKISACPGWKSKSIISLNYQLYTFAHPVNPLSLDGKHEQCLRKSKHWDRKLLFKHVKCSVYLCVKQISASDIRCEILSFWTVVCRTSE